MKLLTQKMEAMRFCYHPLFQKLISEKSRLTVHIEELKQMAERRREESVQDNEKLNKYRDLVVELYYNGKVTEQEIESVEKT